MLTLANDVGDKPTKQWHNQLTTATTFGRLQSITHEYLYRVIRDMKNSSFEGLDDVSVNMFKKIFMD